MYTEPVSIGRVVFFLLLAVLVFSGFWLIRNFVVPLIKSRKISQLTGLWLFRLELLAWALFTVFLLYQFLLDSMLITLVIAGMILLLGWPFWKDFIPGVLFRLENQVGPGDIIRVDGNESIVEQLGARSLRSSTLAGETILTPYHKLQEAVIVRARSEGKLLKSTFTVTLENGSPQAAAQRIEKFLQECPWAAPLEKPEIQHLGEHQFQVTTFSADQPAADKQKAFLLWRITKLKGNK
ncbi:MAG: mechanosensitive ion channel family protein [Bacteroidetes bacterium]|nr:MAG: mechanosensitive ion channel family protein [Bacteroidota bacterium]